MDWFKSKPVKSSGLTDILLEHFVYPHVNSFIYNFILSYAMAIAFGIFIGASPFIFFITLRKCGWKCYCFFWIIIIPLIALLISGYVTYVYYKNTK